VDKGTVGQGVFFPEILFSPFFTIIPSVLNIQIPFIQVKLKTDNILNQTHHFENHKKHLNTLCFKMRSFLMLKHTVQINTIVLI
jgi:hypothetical protein